MFKFIDLSDLKRHFTNFRWEDVETKRKEERREGDVRRLETGVNEEREIEQRMN